MNPLRRRWLVVANELLWQAGIRGVHLVESLWRRLDDGAYRALWRRDHAEGGEAARRWSA